MRTSSPDFEPGTLNAYQIHSDEVQVNDRFGYKIVLVVYESGYLKAYRGPTLWDDQRVQSEGDEVDDGIIKLLFPTLYNAFIGDDDD